MAFLDQINNRASDATLLNAYRSGNLHAWDILVERYEALICAVPHRMGLCDEDVQDVAQNVFIILLNHCDRLRDETRLSAWLVTTAKREAWQWIRRLRARHTAELPPETLEDLPDREDHLLPEESTLALEEQHLVRTALAQMPDRCRNLLTLLYVADPPRTYAEVTEELDLPLGSIGPQRARCLEGMKKSLVKLGF